MKKTHFILAFLLLSLAGCAQEKESTTSSTTKKTISKSTTQQSTAITSTDITQSSTAISAIQENKTASSSTQENEALLSRFSLDQIKAAKVWLTVHNLQFIEDSGDLQFTISQNEVGKPIVPGPGSVNFPTPTTVISAIPLASGEIIYGENEDGTITVYPLPKSFRDDRYLEEEFSRQESQKIIDTATTWPIGNFSDDMLLSFLNRIL